MKPVSLEIVAHVVSALANCPACKVVFKNSGVTDEVNKEILQEYPEAVREDYFRLSTWIGQISDLYKDRVSIRVIDATSLVGVYKAVRHHFRTYPTFIVNGKQVVSGWDRKKLTEVLDAQLRNIAA